VSVLSDEQETGPPLSLSERAYTAIQDKLIMLEIPPMAPIDEVALVESLEVGRTPVREALKRLEVDRLVVSYPRRGTFATAVDITDLAYISDIRVQLEPLAARRAAENAATSTALRAELEDLADATDALDIPELTRDELMRWDLRVHRSVYRAAGNPHLEDTLVRYDNLATRIFCLFLDRLPTVDQHVREHVDLLRAIAAGDADRADELAREHVLGFEKTIRAVI
jgi:DNA-binding GntR family transcriptional regulator